MESKENKINSGIQLRVPTREVITDISGDFSLPDYQPEIRRMLFIRPAVLPTSNYAGSSGVEVNGSIDYYATYIGNDGGMYCAPLSTDYTVNIPASAGEYDTSAGVCRVYSSADGVVGRVIAPRKLNIRCRLHTSAALFGEINTNLPDLEENGAEVLFGRTQTMNVCYGRGDILRLSDDIISGQGGDLRVVCADGNVMISEVTAGNNAVNCHGDVIMKFITAPEGDNTSPTVNMRKIRFSQVVPLSGCRPESQVSASGCCTELSLEVGEGNIHAEVGVIIDATASDNALSVYPKDAYAVDKKLECETENLPAERMIGCINGNFTLGETYKLSDVGIDPKSDIVDAFGCAGSEEIVFENGRCFMIGKAEFCMLCATPDGDGTEYSSVSTEAPFRYEISGMNSAADGFDAELSVPICRARVDGERLAVDAEVSVNALLYNKENIKCVSKVKIGDGMTEKRSGITVCYPSRDDSLWSVAKRCNARISDIAESNGLKITDGEAKLDGVKFLFV